MEQLSSLKNIGTWARSHKPLVVLLGAIIFLLLVFLMLLGAKPSSRNPSPLIQKPFHVVTTQPTNGQTNVFPGEIVISFVTDTPIVAASSYSLEVSPSLQYPLEQNSTFPTSVVAQRVLGGLQQNTRYVVTVRNKNGDQVYSWSFTTSNQQPESSSQLVKHEEQQIINEAYPLFDFIPYSNDDFSIDYTGRLTLGVIIKNRDVPRVKQEVLDWIRGHGVDPSTHTINYTYAF